MKTLRAFWIRLCGLLGRSRTDEEFQSELESHIAMDTEEGMRAGLSREEARRQALIRLGGVEQAKQAYRERATLPWIESLLRDVRYVLRGFRRNRTFAATAIVTLALGIGTTTAVFSVVDRILFRPLPYAHDDRLVSVGLIAPIIPQEFMLGGSYYEWKDNQKPFTSLTSELFTSETGASQCDLTERNPKRLSCASVEANFLPTLGVSPILGRNFLPVEDRPNGPKVAMISYELWRSQYNRDPGMVDRLIHIDNHPVRVIGVLPEDFEMPSLDKADILLPEALDVAAERKADPGHVLYAFARLKPGVSIAQAAAELKPVFDYSLNLAPPQFRSEVHLRVRPIRDRQVQDARLAAWILLGAALAVLLIACANVACLLLTRTATRERELALRSALGAGRGRLIWQTLNEAILLSLFGAFAGLALAECLLQIFLAVAPSSLPFLSNARMDMRIVGFTVLLLLLSAVIFGLIPAMNLPRSIALASRTTSANPRALLRRSMAATQIAVSMILLAGAALLLHSFTCLQTQALGMQVHGVLTASISLNRERYKTPQAQMDFFIRAKRELSRLPGVSLVALSDTVPPGGFRQEQIYSNIAVEGRPHAVGGTGGMVAWRWVTPEYFNALDIPIQLGRGFLRTRFLQVSDSLFSAVSSRRACFPARTRLASACSQSLTAPGIRWKVWREM